MRNPIRLTMLGAACIGLAVAVPASARHSITDDWPLLARDRQGDCQLDIVGNGRFMQLRAIGLAPGEAARLGVTNAAMKPIDWQVRADGTGAWSLIYLPFLWNNGDGTTRDALGGSTVAVSLTGADCALSAAASWKREIRVIP